MSSPQPVATPDSASFVSLSESSIGSPDFGALEDTSYGRSTTLLNDVIARLRDCGTDGIVDLPKIVVIGNESSGKSSLIEAISEVKVPRAADTCTRCPMEVILRRGGGKTDEWKCRISLRKDHNGAGEKVGDSTPILFAETTSKTEVTDLLRGAQLAILNPEVDPAFFVRANLDYTVASSLKFSWNTVVMDITGYHLDITFIDLPGLFSSTEEGDEQIDMVDKLVQSYIRQPKCLILLTISMTHVIKTQSGIRKVKQFDPDGERTIGVLTKPDLIGEGDHDKWLPIIRNEEWKLKQGWYVTRQCSTTELAQNLSPEEVRSKEASLFSDDAGPWKRMIDGGIIDESRLGTSKLLAALGDLLSNMIREKYLRHYCH